MPRREFGGTTHETKVHVKAFPGFRRAKGLGVATGVLMEFSVIARRAGIEGVVGTEGWDAVDMGLGAPQFVETAVS